MLVTVEAPEPRRDWSPFNAASLVDAIDRLYREQVDYIVSWRAGQVGGGLSTIDREDLKRQFGDRWWAAYGPAVGMPSRRRAEIPDLPAGRNYLPHWLEREVVLRSVCNPLLNELQSGRILVEADGDHAVEFQPVSVPIGFWRAANWVLYRTSPHDGALPQLIALDQSGAELPPTYYNPRLFVPYPGSALHAETATVQVQLVSKGNRRGPHSQGAEMVRGLELALKRRKTRPDMTQKALHVAMLDALEIPRDSIPRGFAYDAFRKLCRSWLIEHGFVHEKR